MSYINYPDWQLTWPLGVMILRQVHIGHYICKSPTFKTNIIVENELSPISLLKMNGLVDVAIWKSKTHRSWQGCRFSPLLWWFPFHLSFIQTLLPCIRLLFSRNLHDLDWIELSEFSMTNLFNSSLPSRNEYLIPIPQLVVCINNSIIFFG